MCLHVIDLGWVEYIMWFLRVPEDSTCEIWENYLNCQ